MSRSAARRDRDRMADQTVSAIVIALEQHRAVTASLLDRLDSLVERGGSAAEHLVGPFRSLLREEDQALEPLVDQLARH
jgi:flagellar biosynthesis/type III secretory pathway ATPase